MAAWGRHLLPINEREIQTKTQHLIYESTLTFFYYIVSLVIIEC